MYCEQITVAKLRAGNCESSRSNLKAARVSPVRMSGEITVVGVQALACVTPLLGLGYLVTLVGPEPSHPAATAFSLLRSILLSCQGLLITSAYCFLNTEVTCCHLNLSSCIARGLPC